LSNNRRKARQQELKFAALDVAAQDEHVERGLQLVARLLLERWEARRTKEVSDVEEGN